MLQELALALRLQALDRKIANLETEIATLPKHISEIERRLESHGRRLEADRSALAANQRDRKKLEGDIQLHQQKVSKLRDQMSAVKTNEQYQAFQHEIAYIEAEIRKSEDSILDFMEQSEPLEKNVKSAEVSLKVEGEDGFTLDGRSSMAEIAREAGKTAQKGIAQRGGLQHKLLSARFPKRVLL